MMRDDGSLDNHGAGYLFRIYASEGLIYAPACYYATHGLIDLFQQVTCNTGEALELVLLVLCGAHFIFMVAFAPCVAKVISDGETYWRGLADFHAGHPLHYIIQVYILAEIVVLVYGGFAVWTVNPYLCSMRLPRRVTNLLAIELATILWRTSVHILFPIYKNRYNLENPLLPIAENAPPVTTIPGDTPVETQKERSQRIQKTIDLNFHRIQQAYKYREKLPKFKQLPGSKVKDPQDTNGDVLVKPQPSAVIAVKVRPKSSQSGR